MIALDLLVDGALAVIFTPPMRYSHRIACVCSPFLSSIHTISILMKAKRASPNLHLAASDSPRGKGEMVFTPVR